MSHDEDSKALAVFIRLADMLRNLPGVRFIFAKVAALLRGNRGRGDPGISEFIGEAPAVTISTVDQDAAVLEPSSDRAEAPGVTISAVDQDAAVLEPSSDRAEAPAVTISAVDQDAAVLEPSSDRAEAPAVTISAVDQDAAVLEPSSDRAEAPGVTISAVDQDAAVLEPSSNRAEAPGVTISTVDQDAAVLQPSSDHAIAEPETDDQPEREKLIRRRWTETGIKMWNLDVHGAGHAALNIQGRVELLPPEPGETLPRYDNLEFKMVRSCVDGQAVDQIVCEGVVVDPPKRRARRWSP
jgi:hypothetical protein